MGDADRKRQHLPAAEREQQILEAAIAFFAEHGFAGQTRELARTMGLSHSAIFKYFPSKDALIERVYEQVFVSRWEAGWNALIVDRSKALERRLASFYAAYTDRIFDEHWVRIFVFSGLKGYAIAPRYMALLREELILPAARELRAELDLADAKRLPITAREEEAFWGLHGEVFYLALRRFVYGVDVPADYRVIVADTVHRFFKGVPQLARQCCKS